MRILFQEGISLVEEQEPVFLIGQDESGERFWILPIDQKRYTDYPKQEEAFWSLMGKVSVEPHRLIQGDFTQIVMFLLASGQKVVLLPTAFSDEQGIQFLEKFEKRFYETEQIEK